MRIPLDRSRRPREASAGRVIVGIRPEAFEDAAFAPGDLPQVEVQVAVLEDLGSDAHVFFQLDAEHVIVEEAVRDEEDEDGSLLADAGQGLTAARVDPRTTAQVGGRITLAVDPARLYFFSPESGESLLGSATAAATA
jgi:multiple sugar transport system ATP-binding protein